MAVQTFPIFLDIFVDHPFNWIDNFIYLECFQPRKFTLRGETIEGWVYHFALAHQI